MGVREGMAVKVTGKCKGSKSNADRQHTGQLEEEREEEERNGSGELQLARAHTAKGSHAPSLISNCGPS